MMWNTIAAWPKFAGLADEKPRYGHLPYRVAPRRRLEPVLPDSPYLLKKAAAKAFREMREAAARDGITLEPISAFRTKRRQHKLFYAMAKKLGIAIEERAKVCAPPGFSEHHTGYALDLKDNTPGVVLNEEFEHTPAFQWMLANAHRFGFELSFPRNNPQGIMYEPWHWRYVGDTASRRVFKRIHEWQG